MSIQGDPGSQNPVLVELSYQSEKARSYQIDQPDGTSGTQLIVSSSSSSDTSQSVIIKDDSQNTDTVSLNGTTNSS